MQSQQSLAVVNIVGSIASQVSVQQTDSACIATVFGGRSLCFKKQPSKTQTSHSKDLMVQAPSPGCLYVGDAPHPPQSALTPLTDVQRSALREVGDGGGCRPHSSCFAVVWGVARGGLYSPYTLPGSPFHDVFLTSTNVPLCPAFPGSLREFVLRSP